jgi:predicted nuclease of predicted toxin-antitoxin system
MNAEIKYYTDEHIPSAVVAGLRRRGINVLTTVEAEMLGATDEAQLTLATEQQRVLFTQDDDFLSLHATGIEHTGIVYVHQGASIGYMVRCLHFVFQVLSLEEMINHVEFL